WRRLGADRRALACRHGSHSSSWGERESSVGHRTVAHGPAERDRAKSFGVELVKDGSQGGKSLPARCCTTRAVAIVEQDYRTRSKQALHACHDLFDTGGSRVEDTTVPTTDLV